MNFSDVAKFSTNGNRPPLISTKTLENLSLNEYDSLIDNIWNDLLDDLRIKNMEVDVFLNNNKTYRFRISTLIIQLIYWRCNIGMKMPIEEQDFRNCENLTKGIINDTIDEIDKRILAFDKNADMDVLAEIDADIIEKLMNICEIWAQISSSTVSLYDIIRLEKRVPEVREIIHTPLDKSMSLKEMEQEIVRKRNRLEQLVYEDNQSVLVPYLKTRRFDLAQLGQMFCNVGSRADSKKYILPVPITGNFLLGLENATEYYIEAVTGRDAIITKDKYVAISGALSRKIDLNCLTTKIDQNVEDCGTAHCLEIFVENDNILKLIHEKFMINDDLSLTAIDYKKHKRLIGTTIKVRSHICCTLDGDRICKTCYGAKSPRLKNINVGGLVSIKCVNLISQLAMSQKHKTTTNATTVKNEALDKYFVVEENKCYLREDINLSNAVLMIPKDYIEEIFANNSNDDEYDDEGVNSLELKGVKIRDAISYDKATKKFEECEYELDDDNMFLLLSNEILEYKKFFDVNISEDYAYIHLGKIDKDTPVFDLLLITEEVSLYLKQLLNTIDGGNRTRNHLNYNNIMADLIGIVDRTGMLISVNHLETIIYNLIKDRDNLLERPNFNLENPDYIIEPLSSAVLLKDIYTSFACGYHKRQMTNINTYLKKRPGIYDPFFRINKPVALQ